jgi:hypothetical protein
MSGSAAKIKDVLSVVPPFEGNEEIIKRRQSTPHIIREVLDAHREFAGDYDKIVNDLSFYKTISLEEQLFDFCKKLHYNVESEEDQTTRSPAGIIQLGRDESIGVDCKHYAGYIAGVLDAWNRKVGTREYDWYYRFASYDTNPAAGHVFVVVKYDDGDLWIDPVLSRLDRRFPSPTFFIDKKPGAMLKRLSGIDRGFSSASLVKGGKAGCCDHAIGATGAQVSKSISSLVPIVANIPVIGTIGTYVLEAASIVASIFGDKYSQSTQVRWLTSFYENLVLAKPNRSDNTVNAADCTPAQLWFSTVLGVPVYDALTFHNLNGTDPNTNAPLNNTEADRINAYFGQWAGWSSSINPTTGITPAMVLQAVRIAAPMNADIPPSTLGQWAGMTAAPQVNPAATVVTNADGSLSISNPVPAIIANAGSWIKSNPIPAVLIVVGLGTGIYFLTKPKKKKS